MSLMQDKFDVVIIGSGFGGAVMACRLVEKGYHVCILERGQDYGMHQFPRRIGEIKERLFWDPRQGKYGYMEFRDDPNSDVMTLTASGFGGGSLIYANVLYRVPAENFSGWPGDIKRHLLDPYYDRVLEMMEASPYPEADEHFHGTWKTVAMRRAADRLASDCEMGNLQVPPQFKTPDLAVNFRGRFPGDQVLNKHGALQSKCTRCGECDIGCNIHAKNSLDLNYLRRAQHIGGERFAVRTNAEVYSIKSLEPEAGYEVGYRNPRNHKEIHVVRGAKVVVAAGALHSPALLLKMKRLGNLPDLSAMLGKKWSGNGDLLGIALDCEEPIESTLGPVITSAIEFKTQPYSDGFPSGFYIQDAGYPIGLAWYLAGKLPSPHTWVEIIKIGWRFFKSYLSRFFGFRSHGRSNMGAQLGEMLDRDSFSSRNLMLLGMGRDRSDGEVQLGSDHEPVIRWKLDRSLYHFENVRAGMRQIARVLGGKLVDNPLTDLDKVISVHPLGGCVMGDNREEGVVDPWGQVFGYPDLYVVDGSILPTSTGPNPSLTIAALAERIADKFPTMR